MDPSETAIKLQMSKREIWQLPSDKIIPELGRYFSLTVQNNNDFFFVIWLIQISGLVKLVAPREKNTIKLASLLLIPLPKIFYNRSTNSTAFCALQWLSLPPSFLPMQLKQLNLFLLQGAQPITIRGWDFSQSGNPFTP